MLNKAEREARFAVSHTNLSSRSFLKILKQYGSIKKFLDSEDNYVLLYKNFRSEKEEKSWSHASILELAQNTQDSYIVYGDDKYPNLLMQTPHPPIALTYRGDISLLKNSNLISIVGTRKHSLYGTRVVQDIVYKLAQHSFVFISGMALGIDTIVHKSALERSAKTIAVIPTTLDNPSPKSNNKLFEEISEKGLVISEPKYGYIWDKYLYAQRNRIIAGLSPTTLVIEAPMKSGALITANLAFEYNREVYAVPGNIDSVYSRGCNLLIKNNKAQLFTDVNDILPKQLMFLKSTQTSKGDDIPENKIIELLRAEPLTFDDIFSQAEIKVDILKEVLLELEVQGLICLNNNGKYNMKSN